jgi:tetratricopeptide (TPR) repeat protein
MVAPVQDMKSLITVEQSAALEADVHIQSNFREADIFSLGLRFFKYGRLDLSLAFFSRVLDLNENNAQAYVNIGNIYHKNGDIESAANFWKYAIKIDPACEKAYMNLGNYFYGKKNPISYFHTGYFTNPKPK